MIVYYKNIRLTFLIIKIKMNQTVQSHHRHKSDLNGYAIDRNIQMKKNLKTKDKINSVASKSFSQAFMKQYSSRRSNTKNSQVKKYDNRKQPIVHQTQQQKRTKKYSQMHNNPVDQKDKKKQMLLNALDGKIAKNSVKTTKSYSQNNKSNNSLSNISNQNNQSFKHFSQIQKIQNINTRYANGKLKPNSNLKIGNNSNNQVHKYKSQANIFQSNYPNFHEESNININKNQNININKHKSTKHHYSHHQQSEKHILKGISSTTKHQNHNNKVINHLQNKKPNNKSYLTHHQYQQPSISQRKKISQKLQEKLNGILQANNKFHQKQSYANSNLHQLKIIKQNDKQKTENYYQNQRPVVSNSERKLITYQQQEDSNRQNVKSLEKNQKFISSTLLGNYQRSKNQEEKSRRSYNEEQQRLEFKFAFRTRKGQHVNNPKKVNQDSILVKQNIGKRDLHMVAVADGHGPSGHFVSQFVIKNLSKHFSDQINEISKFQSANSHQLNQQNMPPIQATLFLPKIYDKIQTELSCSQINSATSGCTLVNVILQKNQILCANVGDSRAILARQMDKKNWELIYLSQDHKPENQTQKKRILKCGGRIHTFKGQKGQNLGPLRVWLPNQNMQGLAMTRSFGDNISKAVGVTHKPQMIKVKTDGQKDKFILVASDGVWEFISNQQILQLIVPFYKDKKLEQACDALLKLSYDRWTQGGDDSVVDDISFVLIFLHC